jgi:putative methyltransferase (TIGR04325 family)
MARAPRISVILPCYNHAPFVAQAIESVLSQSFSDFELIITDDGSTDGTADEVRSFSDSRISFEALPANRGYSSVLNMSLARARGELVALHCSDDVFLPDKLERQIAVLDANPGLAAVFGKAIFVGKDGQPCPLRNHPYEGVFADDLSDRFSWLQFFFLRGNALCHPTALLRRAVYDEVGGYDPLLVQLQDYDFWIRMSSRHEIRVLDEPLIAFRVLGEGFNTSWPGAKVVRRTAWETRRVLRRYLAFDPALIQRVFGAQFAELGLTPDMPPRAALGLLLAMRAKDVARQALALEFLEEAVAAGDAGIDHSIFHRLVGELDPFNLGAIEAERQAAERLVTAELCGAAAEDRARAAEARSGELERHLMATGDHSAAMEARAGEFERRLVAAEDRAAAMGIHAGELERHLAAAKNHTAAVEARVKELEERAIAAESLARAVTSSTIWRTTASLRSFAERRPAVRLALRWAMRVKPQPALKAPLNGVREETSAGQAEGVTERCQTVPELRAPAAALEPAPAVLLLPEWEYVPEGWRPDDPRVVGWEHPSIVETQLRKWPDFVRAVQSTQPLGVYHEAAQVDSENPVAHNFVLAFAYVLARAAAGRNSLSVLDWGGGVGHYAVIARATLPEVQIDYTVLDLPGLCSAGRTLLPDVRFTSDAEECLSRRYDLIFASGSLQYAADWQGLLRRFANSAERWVFLNRTPFVNGPSFVVVQRPHSAGGYQTEYLSRVFNRDELLSEAAAAGLAIEREFLMPGERVAAVGAPEPFEHRGFLLRP